MGFLSTVGWLFFFGMGVYRLDGFLVPFTPISPRELHPESLKLCVNCKEAHVKNHQLQCTLFGKTDPLFGNVYYDTCRAARSNESMCGTQARYYYFVALDREEI
jgi:hypothetical protein